MKHAIRSLAAIALLGSLSGCSEDSETLELAGSQSGEVVSAKVDQRIEVTLQSVGPGIYGTPRITSAAVTFEHVSFVEPPNPAGPRQRFRFQARNPGQAAIDIPHSAQGSEFSITVFVE
jgi:hypothetical protein